MDLKPKVRREFYGNNEKEMDDVSTKEFVIQTLDMDEDKAVTVCVAESISLPFKRALAVDI